MENWPLVGDRYDPYDPMWSNPFWRTYATGPATAPAPAPETGRNHRTPVVTTTDPNPTPSSAYYSES